MSARVPQGSGLARLGELLTEAGYTVEGIGERLGERASSALHREQRLPADLATHDASDPPALLTRLLALGLPVPMATLRRAAPETTDLLVGTGVVAPEGPDLVTRFDLRPYGDEEHSWLVLSDLSEVMTGRPLPEDHVLGIGGASTTLASWTPRQHVGDVLDLGTGCGVQSLHAATHADRVVGTDLSARALEVARANAVLNHQQWELLRGSLFEPVAGERFDLVVSNPPFVITPRTPDVPLYEYRDGGQVGHDLVRQVVGRVGDHLRPGGVAQLLGNWEVRDGETWQEVVGSWVDGTGLDAWVVQRDVQDPAQYAEMWCGDGGHRVGTPGYEDLYAAWLRDFDTRGVREVGFGVLTLQRPASAREPWRELAEVTGPIESPVGPHVHAGLAARTWLAENGDAGVLARRWRYADDVTEERHGLPGADDPSVIVVRQGGGLRSAHRASTVESAFLSVCDGELTAGQSLEAIAALVGGSPDAVRDEALPWIRRLVADGLLV